MLAIEENDRIERELEKLESEVSKISDGPSRYEYPISSNSGVTSTTRKSTD